MKVIGHRGAAGLAPENTYAAFDSAIRLGVDAIEMDVQMTMEEDGNGILVVFHDEKINRTTNGKGILQEMTWAELKDLDAGSWFHPQYADQRIPLLTDFLKRYGKRIPIDLEIKQLGIEEKVLEAVLSTNVLDNITFTSFNFETAKRIRALAPEAKVGFLTSEISPQIIDQALSVGLTQFSPEASQVTPELVTSLKEKGLFVRAWGVTTESQMHNLITAGVEGMTVDFPDRLLQVLGRGEQTREDIIVQSEYQERPAYKERGG